MSTTTLRAFAACLSVMGATVLAGPVFADPPQGPDHDQQKHGQNDKHGGPERGGPEHGGSEHGGQGHGGAPAYHEAQAPMRHDAPASKPRQNAHADFRFGDSHRDVVVNYERDHHYACPRGLVTTEHGCLPRGKTHKRYTVGRALPSGVVIETLPRDLLVSLPPPPSGYMYRRVDGDVLLIAEGTRKVLDALVLFSAVGR